MILMVVSRMLPKGRYWSVMTDSKYGTQEISLAHLLCSKGGRWKDCKKIMIIYIMTHNRQTTREQEQEQEQTNNYN